MDPLHEARPARSNLLTLLFPEAPRYFPWARPAQLVLRSLHIAAMAMVVGAIPFGAPFEALRLPILLTLARYLAATLVASVGSHMPGSWRHFSFLHWKVMRYPD